MLLFNKPNLIGKRNSKTMMPTVTATTTLMEPNKTPSSLSSSTSTTAVGYQEEGTAQLPQSHPEEPLLNCIPSGVFPTYRPVPFPIQLAVICLSLWTAAVTTWKRLTWLQPLAILRGWRKAPSVAEMFAFVGKALLLTVFAKTVIQDLFLRPSRLSMNKLSQRYFFPSALSKYETLSISNGNGTAEKLGVHYLEYSNPAEATNFDALYVNHGFGASSLSWLPAIPSLTKKIGAKVCLGHDAAGFGFTDRPESLESYSAAGSARIATNLLLQKSPSTPKSVALFGHSLGALTTLKMALQLPKETSKFIVLCAPALGLGKARLSSFSPTKRWWSPIGAAIRRGLVYPIFGYALRRAVGTNNFWKKGLQAAWGDPQKLRDSDVLRFQWPSIGLGWERGLMEFSRAQTTVFGEDGLQDDAVLLRRVLELPNTKVFVVLGSSDPVIASRSIRNFLKEFEVPIVELEGLGHDAFEEETEAFCDAVHDFLKSTLDE